MIRRSERGTFSTASVRTGNALIEPKMSGSAPKADMRTVSLVALNPATARRHALIRA
jgi:hypothetical protein